MRLAGLALALLVLCLAGWFLLGETQPPIVPPASQESRTSDVHPAAPPSPPADVTERATPRHGSGTVLGSVLRGESPVSARISVHLREAYEPGSPLPKRTRRDSWLMSPATSGPPFKNLTTDSKGRFRVRDLAPGLYQLD